MESKSSLKEIKEYIETQSAFSIETLGCKVNQAESEKIASFFQKAGCLRDLEKPSLRIVNTCAVTAEAEAKSRKLVRRCLRDSSSKKILAIGCAASLIKDSIGENERVVFIDSLQKTKFMEELEKITINDIAEYSSWRTRALLKVQDGCNRHCSYCIVPQVRGGEKSISLNKVIAEAEQFNEKGIKEVVLTGVHLGRYGEGEKSLPHLINSLLKHFDFRIRLSSIDVEDLTDDLLEVMANSKGRVCPHLHIPLQSGSDKILRLMKRSYSKVSFLQKVEKVKKALKMVALSTDVMVGFPHENDKDFHDTLEMIREVGFMRLHVFRYSQRPGTAAVNYKRKVDFPKAKQREKEILCVGEKLEDYFKRKLSGKNLSVLFEEKRNGKWHGRSEYYVEVEFDKEAKRGEIVKLRVRYENGKLIGEV